MNKDFLNRIIVFLKKIFQDTVKWISFFYTKKILPFLIDCGQFVKEYFKSVTITVKEDNQELLDYIMESFIALEYFRKSAINWIEVKIYEVRNARLTKIISRTVAPEKLHTKFPEFLKDIYYHIRFLSFRRLILYSLMFITLDIFLLWFGTYRILYAKHYWEGTQDKKFFIRPGKNLDEIIDDLKENDILKSKFIFKIYVVISGKDDKIISKRYIFNNGISNSELLNILTDRNMVQMEKFTLIEGLRIKQIARIVETRLQLSQEKFIKETENDSLINIIGLKGKIKNLEGFLFPDTYYLPLNVDEKELVSILFNEFRKKVLNDENINGEIREKDKNLLDIIILASIIQGETNLKDEMPVISGVYYNRLSKRMKLEADPTIQYVLPDGPKPKLKYSDLRIDSPYNTYKYFGLPPGPINNPGLYAIKAAIEPDENNFLFFVATGNGGHKFSATYDEHLRAVEEYKKNTEKKSE